MQGQQLQQHLHDRLCGTWRLRQVDLACSHLSREHTSLLVRPLADHTRWVAGKLGALETAEKGHTSCTICCGGSRGSTGICTAAGKQACQLLRTVCHSTVNIILFTAAVSTPMCASGSRRQSAVTHIAASGLGTGSIASTTVPATEHGPVLACQWPKSPPDCRVHRTPCCCGLCAASRWSGRLCG